MYGQKSYLSDNKQGKNKKTKINKQTQIKNKSSHYS